jgi:hypothetical protein
VRLPLGRKASTFVLPVALLVAPLHAQSNRPGDRGQVLSVDGRTNANVSLSAAGSLVTAAWGASLLSGGTDIYAAVSRDGGVTFGAPVRVNAKAGDAHVNGEQPPRVALRRTGAATEIVVVWTSKGSAGGTIVSARSSDFGRTFGPTTVVPGGDAAGNRGWENVAVDSAGRVRVVWLDHRELAQSASMSEKAEHHTMPADSKKDAVSTAQHSKLYTAAIGDAASVRAITGGVCYCCKTAIVAADDDLYLAWRHVYPQNVRDMAFTESHDRGRTFADPVRVSEDKWQIEGCPEDGPALAIDGKRQIHIVWPTLVTDTPNGQPSIGIFYAPTTAARRFGARQRVPTEGVPHHPQIAVSRNMLYLAWDELKNGARAVVLAGRPVSAPAGTPWSRSVLSGATPGTYPSLAATDSGLAVAWMSPRPTSAIRVVTISN